MVGLLIIPSVHSRVRETVSARAQVNFEQNRRSSTASVFPRSQPLRQLPPGLLKDWVSEENSQTTERLKEKIKGEIKKISVDMLERAIDNLNARVTGVI